MPRFTPAEYQALLARQAKPAPAAAPASTGDAPAPERELHAQILAECRRRGWLALHGSMAHFTHRTLGEPDFVILAEAGAVYLVECKTRLGKLSAEQLGFAAQARLLGHTVHVVRSLDEFHALMRSDRTAGAREDRNT